jgi:hypothetical protein
VAIEFVTGDDVLAQVGASSPSAFETEWAGLVAGAVNDGIVAKLGGSAITDPPPAELVTAARYAATEAYKRREVPFGVLGFADLQGTAYRVARDYLEGVAPIIGRYRTDFGIG